MSDTSQVQSVDTGSPSKTLSVDCAHCAVAMCARDREDFLRVIASVVASGKPGRDAATQSTDNSSYKRVSRMLMN